MKKDKKTQISPDHPIREIWKNNQKSFIDLAREGDKDAIKTALVNFRYRRDIAQEEWERGVYKVQPNRHYDIPPDLMEYLLDCFDRIIKGESPNEAFNWGAKGKSLTAKQKEERAMIGHEVATLMHGKRNLTLDEASEEVAENHGIKDSMARAAYTDYMAI